MNNRPITRGGFKAAATSKVELSVIIVNGWKPLTIITKSSVLDVAAVRDPLLLHEPKDEENSKYEFDESCVDKSEEEVL